jgi:hypothetical protein
MLPYFQTVVLNSPGPMRQELFPGLGRAPIFFRNPTVNAGKDPDHML